MAYDSVAIVAACPAPTSAIFTQPIKELRYTSNKTSAKVYPIQIVLFCIHVSVIDDQISQIEPVLTYPAAHAICPMLFDTA